MTRSTRRPRRLPSGPHGTPVWQRKLTGPAVLKSAKSNTLLLYRSTAIDGKRVAVSGDVAVPKGKAPKGGWPVITWAHGTVGIADACAPSKIGTQANYDSPLLNRWLKAGYAVVRTDYEGLGTPGPHPYLIGVSEGRSTLDMVRAARKLDPDDRQAARDRRPLPGRPGGAVRRVAGRSKWTPELKLNGHGRVRARQPPRPSRARCCARSTEPSGLSALAAMIVRGIDIANPSLERPEPAERPGQGALPADRREVPRTTSASRTRSASSRPRTCSGRAPTSTRSSPRWARTTTRSTLKIPGPVLIEQGKADTTVLPELHRRARRRAQGQGRQGDLQDLRRRRPRRRRREQGAVRRDATKWIEQAARARDPRRGRSTRCSRRRRRDGPPPPSPSPC